ncbi:hypothetical protein KI688_006393 [Linnemannia hyalina]|uniref:Uncharacterized protein n=1 Tax=Linnemannia hyalina TaxID=64524 RepID=A0A9P7Y2K3_9FUNG|nr:hypothetical protein KI688_006393 [Linnemannia hyalina]
MTRGTRTRNLSRTSCTRSTTRAVARVAHLNDRLVAAYSDSVLQEAETQLTDLTSGNGEETSADTSSQGSHSKANAKAKARAGNGNNSEQRANVAEQAEDGFDAGTDAQGDTDADEDEAELTETSPYSPFCDLIKDLYQRFGHDQEKMKLLAKPISSPLVQELHAHARHLLETWREDDLINQKQLFVALSCIINTIDGDNAAFHNEFADHKKSCVVEGFMTPTQRQLDFVERMMQETNFLHTLDLDTLDIFSLRHACDLRVSFKQESPFFQVPNTEAMKEELTICSLVHILKLVELFCWEAKTADAGSIQLQVQRCKNLRLNACFIGTTHSMAGLDRRRPVYPLPSPLLLDIAGRTALPYKIHKINPDVFVAGAVTEKKGLICLPRTKEDMVDFLREGMRKVKKEEAKNRMLGYDSLDEGRNPVINTPIKRYKVATPRMPTLKRPRQKSPSKAK